MRINSRRAVPGRDGYLDDVETKKNIRIVEQSQPGQAAARNSSLLFSVDRFKRPAEIFARPRFHFDEDERVAIAADDVDFAAVASAKIAIENFVAVPAQKTAASFSPCAPRRRCAGLEGEKRLRHRLKRAAMDWTRSVFMQFHEMQFRAVTFVLAETIFRETRAKFTHQCVARHFCDHARRRDAQAEAIAIDDRGLRKRKGKTGRPSIRT